MAAYANGSKLQFFKNKGKGKRKEHSLLLVPALTGNPGTEEIAKIILKKLQKSIGSGRKIGAADVHIGF